MFLEDRLQAWLVTSKLDTKMFYELTINVYPMLVQVVVGVLQVYLDISNPNINLYRNLDFDE